MEAEPNQIASCDGSTVRLCMPMTQSAFTKSRISERLSEEGLVATQDGTGWSFSAWKFTGTSLDQSEGRESVMLEGAAFPCSTLLSSLSSEAALLDATLAVRAMEEAAAAGHSVPNVGAGGILIGKGGTARRVLFLPEMLFSLAASCLGGNEASRLDGLYRRNDLSGHAAVQFAEAVLAYRMVSGRLPFTEPDSDKRHEDILDRNFVPLELAAPGTDSQLAFFVDNALSRSPAAQVHRKSSSAKRRTLADTLTAHIQESETESAVRRTAGQRISFPVGRLYAACGITPDGSAMEEGAAPLPHGEAECTAPEWRRFQRSLKAKRWLRRHRTALTVTAAVAFAALILSATQIRGRMSNPTTQGLDSVQVTEVFYSAYNALDIVALQASSSGKQMRRISDMLSGFYVSAKTRETYSGSGKTVPPAEWLVFNREATYSIYGLTNLTIDGLPAHLHAEAPSRRESGPPLAQENGRPLAKGDSASHTVCFHFVYSEGTEELHVLTHTDTVTLTYDGKKWRCTGIAEDVDEAVLPFSQFISDYRAAGKDGTAAADALRPSYPWISTAAEIKEAEDYLLKQDELLFGR